MQSGALKMDHFDPANIVSTRIIQGGLVGYGHLRCAAPNDRPRDKGSIQYPLVDPASDPRTPWRGELACGGTWQEARTRAWKELYRQAFAYQLSHPERPVARFASEFIGWNDHCDYRIEGYGNLHQNLAVVAWAQGTKRIDGIVQFYAIILRQTRCLRRIFATIGFCTSDDQRNSARSGKQLCIFHGSCVPVALPSQFVRA